MTSHTDNAPEQVTIRPKDRVRLDDGDTEYTVQAVSRAGQDVYVTEGNDASIGTWVAISSVTEVVLRAAEEAKEENR